MDLLATLKNIDVSKVSYHDWISVGMALKAEGYDVSVWDEWSKNDTRYKPGECDRKWGALVVPPNLLQVVRLLNLQKIMVGYIRLILRMDS